MNYDSLILPKNTAPLSTIGGKRRRSRRNRTRKHNKSRTRRRYY